LNFCQVGFSRRAEAAFSGDTSRCFLIHSLEALHMVSGKDRFKAFFHPHWTPAAGGYYKDRPF
jgi:hypothetical protein